MVSTKSLPIITHEKLLEALDYSPKVGIFIWKKWINGRPPVGTITGHLMTIGYLSVTIFQRKYYAHRLAWFYMTGEWPTKEIDHINGNRTDNRWENLREANRSQNTRNSKRRHTNTIGYKGVTLDKRTGRYGARARLNGEYFHFGWFDDPYEAHLAYVKGTKELHGEFARSE